MSSTGHALRTLEDELRAAQEGVQIYGDAYSQGLFQCLIGQLSVDLEVIREGLLVFAHHGLEEPFFRAAVSAKPVLRSTVSDAAATYVSGISKIALQEFGKPMAHKLMRAVLDQVGAGGKMMPTSAVLLGERSLMRIRAELPDIILNPILEFQGLEYSTGEGAK